MSVSNMANGLIGSEIIRIAGEINEMKKKGLEICNLTIGDFNPDFYPIPAGLRQEIINAYVEGHTNYPASAGIAELRKSVAEFMFQKLNLAYSEDEIQVSCGSRPLIYATYLALLNKDDVVIYPTPSWNNNHYCHLVGARGIAVETRPENNFMPVAADLLPYIQEANMIALCSPLNPTGTAFSRESLQEICELVVSENKRRGEGARPLLLMFDQVYWQLTFGNTKHYEPVGLVPEIRDYTVIIDGISKSYSATGVRVGWALGPVHIISKIRSILGHVGAWAPRAEQLATARFLRDPESINDFLFAFREKLLSSLDMIHQFFTKLKEEGYPVDSIVPQGAIYLSAKLDVIGKTTPDGDLLLNNKDVANYILASARVGIVPFAAFGTSDQNTWFRLSVGGCSIEEIQSALPRLKASLDALV